ncbi:MAG: FHA domain-containing protein [Rhodopirellula sp. JB044]|uniref:FHA domain-containing protein n=1 Tax=Rhodopirellula sp. JB044 TaxID=3342844 RepID=UPI00370BD488
MPASEINQARLVLSTGSRAGLLAPIHPGFYLIGRDKNCQIRPKTRSVSRVHCLLYFGVDIPQPLDAPDGELLRPNTQAAATQGRFHVIDLDSTSGTKLDGERLPPRSWTEVSSGTELRCGKMAWNVVIEPIEKVAAAEPAATRATSSAATSAPASPTPAPAPATRAPAASGPVNSAIAGPVIAGPVVAAPPEGSEKMLTGNAWQGADVAAFLAAHDDADREARYENIRAKSKMKSDESGLLDEDDDGSQFLNSAASGLSLATTETVSEAPLSDAPTLSEASNVAAAAPTPIKSPAEQKAEAARAKREARNKKASEKRAARKAESAKRAAALDGENPLLEKTKLVLAVALTIAVLGFGAYQFIQFRSGPPPRVVDGID